MWSILSDYWLVASGAALAGAAVVAWAARFHPSVAPVWLFTEALVIVTALLSSMASWQFSALHSDTQVEIDQLRADLDEMTRQRDANERIARKSNDALADRIDEGRELQKQVAHYEMAIAGGGASACPADPAYTRSMQSIQIGPKAEPARTGD